MAEHFTHTTVEASAWCATCSGFTMHHFANGRKGGCQVCIRKLEEKAAVLKALLPVAKQETLF